MKIQIILGSKSDMPVAEKTKERGGNFTILTKDPVLTTTISEYDNNLSTYCNSNDIKSYLQSYHKAQD